MKLGFFIHRYYPARGGAERYIQTTAEYCADMNDSVTVHTTNALNLQSFILKNQRYVDDNTTVLNKVKIIRHKIAYPFLRRYWGNLPFKLGILPGKMRGYIHPATPIVPSMRKIKPDFDIIISTAIPYDYINLTASMLSTKYKIPFVFIPFLHLSDLNDPKDTVRHYYTQKYQINLIQRADGVIAQTDIEKDYLISNGVDEQKITKIGQGIDTKSYSLKNPKIFRKKYNIPDNAFVIGHLGNLSFEKGSIDLLKAFKKFSCEKNIYLVYAGAKMDLYKNFAESMTDCKNFRDAGVIDDTVRDEFFSAIDCFCLPSRVESFGVVFLESWLFEKPVITYKAGGIPGVIDNNKNGLLVKTGDIDDLANKIFYLYKNPELRVEYGKAGKQKLENQFTLDSINRKTYGFLRKIAKK